ncbi:NADH:ubiquinone oxidoreductase kD subunit [Tolypocladium paradoxum]|uniref:NADH dehydrogenase [ubiquinone] 1 alpha subcomplex subunit n=1 Tax=Tolypocladium paradoxum TaxID=94208 RepID=A0A2S4KNZ6_9HYPO|nr:NADH:ubiquinone oxidoreductase kD subunit [Tolypocladium paradoxum]
MSTVGRTLSNLRKVGIKVRDVLPLPQLTAVLTPLSTQDYFRQMLTEQRTDDAHAGDTKHGRLIGQDRAGNKFFENTQELPLRTRWVEYAKHDYDAAQIDPGWHAWISYSVDQPPTHDALMVAGTRLFEKPHAQPNYTQTRGAFKTYSTTKPKLTAWEPVAAQRA